MASVGNGGSVTHWVRGIDVIEDLCGVVVSVGIWSGGLGTILRWDIQTKLRTGVARTSNA